eukprot:Gb_26749 [translate_table: standard]
MVMLTSNTLESQQNAKNVIFGSAVRKHKLCQEMKKMAGEYEMLDMAICILQANMSPQNHFFLSAQTIKQQPEKEMQDTFIKNTFSHVDQLNEYPFCQRFITTNKKGYFKAIQQSTTWYTNYNKTHYATINGKIISMNPS